MFDLAKLGIVHWPVTLAVDNGDGTFTDVPVTIGYRVFTRAELRERGNGQMQAALTAMLEIARRPPPGTADELVQREADIRAASDNITSAAVAEEDVLIQRMVSWTGFVGDGGKPVDYTPALGRALIEHEPHFRALWNGLMESSQQARPKNSSPGADGATAPGQTTTG